jgi:hypothetical protein
LNLFATIAVRARDPQALARFFRSLRVLGPAMVAVLGFVRHLGHGDQGGHLNPLQIDCCGRMI